MVYGRRKPLDAHWYISDLIDPQAICNGAERAAARGKPQLVHFHALGASCEKERHRVYALDRVGGNVVMSQ